MVINTDFCHFLYLLVANLKLVPINFVYVVMAGQSNYI